MHTAEVCVCVCTKTPSFRWEVIQVQSVTLTQKFTGHKICLPRFTPYYCFMKQAANRRRRGTKEEKQRDPPAWGLWCASNNLLNLPSNGVHMMRFEPKHTTVYVPFLLSSDLSFTYLQKPTHTCFSGEAVWRKEAERGNMQQIKCTKGGGWAGCSKKILVIVPCCCSIALPKK